MSINYNKNIYYVIGLMSGTSLDGLDIAYCKFVWDNNILYEILVSKTIPYTPEMAAILKDLENASALQLTKADWMLGTWMGTQVLQFINENNIKDLDFVASHGHTIFHQPQHGFTLQIGKGAAIAATCHSTVIDDFRSMDVAFGGQGAPLVPLGDKMLFGAYTFCLNLGGIANISFQKNGQSIAFDICPVNMVLNYLAGYKGLDYDDKGKFAQAGSIDPDLLLELNALSYYQLPPPKSLGKEYVTEHILPLLNRYNISIEDKLATYCEHVALILSQVVKDHNGGSVSSLLVTGGGALNTFLLLKLGNYLSGICNLIIPDERTVKFKEALIFAFLGVLRIRHEVNCLSSVTGGKKNTIGGCVYLND